MARFIVRVELHVKPGDESVYKTLHSFMELGNFKRTIKSDASPKSYHLPPAEYTIEIDASLAMIKRKAESAAQLTGVNYAILAMEILDVTWVNLEEDTDA